MNDAERAEVIRKVKAQIESNPEKREQIRQYAVAAKPIIDELAERGYQVETLSDLRHLGRAWKSALPVLLRWFSVVQDPGVKEDIVRCLSVPWVGNRATPQLIEEFKMSVGAHPLLAWAIGNALSIVGVDGFEAEIIELANNPAYGMARQMIVMSLGRFRADPEAESVALALLEDAEVKLHAIIALGKMKSSRAIPKLETLLADKKGAIRKEARKALTQIARQDVKKAN